MAFVSIPVEPLVNYEFILWRGHLPFWIFCPLVICLQESRELSKF